MNRRNKNRQGNESVSPNPTPSHPMISLGEKTRRLLEFLYKLQKDSLEGIPEAFNISAFARREKCARPTVYDRVNKLKSLKFVSHEDAGGICITARGVRYMNVLLGVSAPPDGGVGSGTTKRTRQCKVSRREKVSGRVSGVLSSHMLSYSLSIRDRSKLNELKLHELGKVKRGKLTNFEQYIVSLPGATVFVNDKTVILRLHEILGKSQDENEMQGLEQATEIFEKLRNCGIEGEEIKLLSGHYARVRSLFAEVLEKKFGKVHIPLKNGMAFWIDHSTGDVEDETDDRALRAKLDRLFNELNETDASLIDLDRMLQIRKIEAKIEAMRHMKWRIRRARRHAMRRARRHAMQRAGGIDYVG